MEKHKCKLCTRTFANGRALGGHMKAHLATLPLPPKTTLTTQQQLGDRTESASSSYSSSGAQREREIKNREVEEKALVYGLRENPKKSFRFADPEFSFAVDAGSLVQDRESETESRNPTRIRSKRTRKSGFAENQTEFRYQETEVEESKFGGGAGGTRTEEIKVSKIRGKLRCEKCMKLFRSSQALGTHKRICSLNGTELRNNEGNERIFECPYCFKVFGSGQALGGHKRSHLMGTSTPSAAENSVKLDNNLIDLNLPAPTEDDDFSVVSDA
ncbi:hypothetical protein GH714_009206 [Hevea brasiliensis]|uniref:C2H2-type domain-containing protein n=1 Tax=Hevea brasiliensis TaxID=3981 RepID=A0A6A6MHA9_HEVBR|nr:hypothetical protein GH714_009206 [Hevea brasiliensis]